MNVKTNNRLSTQWLPVAGDILDAIAGSLGFLAAPGLGYDSRQLRQRFFSFYEYQHSRFYRTLQEGI
jgi:hypothetical protein